MAAPVSVLAAAFIISGLSACFYEAPSQGIPDAGPQDAGELPGADAGGPPSDAGIEQPDPTRKFGVGGILDLLEHPLAGEGHLDGYIDVLERKHQPVPDATVTVNGTLVPETSPGTHKTSAVDIAANPGEALMIHAEEGADADTVEVACPGPVQFTSHIEGQAVSPGEALTITWQGDVRPNHSFYPEVHLEGYDASSNTVTQDSAVESILEGENSVQLVVPDTAAGGYLLRLRVWGNTAYSNASSVKCNYEARIHLTKK